MMRLTLGFLSLSFVFAACNKSKDGESAGTDSYPESGLAPDGDGDGYGPDSDCDDTNPNVYYGATEYCDGVDNDCDGLTDEDDAADAPTWYADADADTFGDLDNPKNSCAQPDGFVEDSNDCDDTDTAINPDAEEVCDGVDNDCDGQVDEGVDGGTDWYADTDGDGYGDASDSVQSCEAPPGYVADGNDCDDTNAAYHPGADESDCTDPNDYNCDGSTGMVDADADGWAACQECDDGDVAVNPDALEVCDDVDNDCDGTVDEDDALDATTWYADADSDAYGDVSDSIVACDQPAGYVEEGTDCDDTDAAYNPGADESDCTDPNDYNCDGSTGYADLDGDTFAACDDCDDTNPAINPAASEICNDVDDDCDGSIDESTATDAGTWYEDADGDTYGDASSTLASCDQPTGYVAYGTDCNDADAAYNPGADESDCTDPNDYNCDGSTGYADADSDGFPACSECNDTDAAINPVATEVCDGVDNDCDGEIDEDSASGTSTWYQDLDGDGYGDDYVTMSACTQPDGYAAVGSDCDDTDSRYNPGALESDCTDPNDYNCDGSTGFADLDADGYAACSECDDTNSTINPGATEVCDGLDNNCDGTIDEASAADVTTWYADADADGYGTDTDTVDVCDQPLGYVAAGGDCDDTDSAYNPGAAEDDCTDPADYNCDGSTGYSDGDGDGFAACADCDDANADINTASTEVCDGADNNCDGTVDEATATDAATWYADTDNDGQGDPGSSVRACSAPAGYVSNSTDCDDNNADVHVGAPELCNDIDDDCDGFVDEGAVDAPTWYADVDGDLYGDASLTIIDCDQPANYVADGTDCDDTDAAYNPGVVESDCTDPNDYNCDGTTGYVDGDGDGWAACAECDDGNADVNPAATEMCDGIDNNCDGSTDEDTAADATYYYDDSDSDGFGDSTGAWMCYLSTGYIDNNDDCNDANAAVNPAATEVCNGIDDNCDTAIDESTSADATTWYADSDSDAYGNPASPTDACSQPSGYVADSSDCNDALASVNPSGTEVCNSIDDDCDTLIDEDGGVADGNTYYGDSDSDDFGDASVTISACDLPSGYADNDWDCDDGDPSEPQYVTSSGSSGGAGSYSDPLDSIQAAIDASTVCVLVNDGTYSGDIDFSGKDITVSSVNGADSTFISGSGEGAVVSFVSGETAAATLTGFTISGGTGHLSSSTLSSACTSETTCYSYYSDYCGGGVYANSSDPTLSDLVVQDNTLPVSSTTPSGNDTYYVDSFGGGLCFESSNATLTGVDVLSNFAEQGGGLFVDELSSVSASQGWFMSNTATDGGSVDVEGSISLTNIASLFNEASGYCGGAMANGGTLNETNVTHGGDDSVSGGQVCSTAASTTTITDTIVYGATGIGVYSSGGSLINLTYNDVYGNTLGNYSGVTDPTGTSGNLSANPLFTAWTDDGNTANDDITLGGGSPAINTGDPSSAMYDTDGSRNDMGAYGGPGGSWN